MKNLLLFSFIIYCGLIYSQESDRVLSVYPRLDTVNYYQIKSESMTIVKGQAEYRVDDKIVAQQEWRKMTIGKERIKTCTPCVVKTFDTNDKPVCTAAQYNRCMVGFYIGYYTDGKVKVKGNYKENNTGRWDKDSLNKFCGHKDGLWTSYNETGKITETNLWKNGKFIKQQLMGK